MLSLIKMTRPVNVLMASLSVLLGSWVAGASLHSIGIYFDALALGLLAAAGNLHNDLVDIDIDRINQPLRPLPAGLISPIAVLWTTAILGAFAAAIGFFRGFPHLIFVIAILILLWLYNRFGKGRAHVGNLAVSTLCASALAIPLLIPQLPHPERLYPLLCFAFFFTWAREIVKDIEDIAGDTAANLRTFPIVSGVESARVLAKTLIVISSLSILAPVAVEIYPLPFLPLAAVLVLPFAGAALFYLAKSQNSWRKAQKCLKLAMLGGFFSIVFM